MTWSGSFISDILQASNGLVRYQIAKRIELDEFPVLTDGFSYTPAAYLDVVAQRRPGSQPIGNRLQAIAESIQYPAVHCR